MVTHMVMFQFEDPLRAAEAVEKLLSMRGKMDSVLEIEAGVDFTRSERSFEVGLITRHRTESDLRSYRLDPIHLEVAAFVKLHASGSAAVDFKSANE